MPWYPDMRQQLLCTASRLADPEYQQRVWVRREMPPGIDVDSFDQAVHFIYDDTCLGEDADEAIGLYVRDEREARAIKSLVDAMDKLFSAKGTNLTDAEYLASQEWPQVVDTAKALCRALESDAQ
jgi:hypothetical protein